MTYIIKRKEHRLYCPTSVGLGTSLMRKQNKTTATKMSFCLKVFPACLEESTFGHLYAIK